METFGRKWWYLERGSNLEGMMKYGSSTKEAELSSLRLDFDLSE
jgi:hypothetical protein